MSMQEVHEFTCTAHWPLTVKFQSEQSGNVDCPICQAQQESKQAREKAEKLENDVGELQTASWGFTASASELQAMLSGQLEEHREALKAAATHKGLNPDPVEEVPF